jgi:hypothetical protein
MRGAKDGTQTFGNQILDVYRRRHGQGPDLLLWKPVLPLARYAIMHPIGAVSLTNLYNMVLIFLFVIAAAIVVAISRVRNRIWFEGDFLEHWKTL